MHGDTLRTILKVEEAKAEKIKNQEVLPVLRVPVQNIFAHLADANPKEPVKQDLPRFPVPQTPEEQEAEVALLEEEAETAANANPVTSLKLPIGVDEWEKLKNNPKRPIVLRPPQTAQDIELAVALIKEEEKNKEETKRLVAPVDPPPKEKMPVLSVLVNVLPHLAAIEVRVL